MARATVQLNVKIDPKIHASMKTRARRESIALAQAVENACTLYLKSNGSSDASPDAAARAATEGA